METLDNALTAQRSMVAMNVPWSGYALRASSLLRAAATRLGELGITFAVVDEESSEVRMWLDATVSEGLGDCPLGAGSLFWLECGRIVDMEVAGGNLTLGEVMGRTRQLWGANRTTTPAR